MENRLISVVITTYGRTFTFIRKAVESVTRQTYRQIEILVVDDNGIESPFGVELEDGLHSLGDPRITLIHHQTNQGACAARNTGIAHAKGEYIAFLDDDDEWLPEKLALQEAILTKDPSVGLVYCNYFLQVGDQPMRPKRKSSFNGYVFDKLLYRNFIGSTSFVMIRKAVVEQCGPFNINMKSSQDYEYWLRIAKQFKIFGLQQNLVIYHAHAGQRITTSVQNRIDGIEMLNSIYHDDMVKSKRILSRRKLVLAPYYVARDGYVKGMAYALKTYFLYPFSLVSLAMVILSGLGKKPSW
jgi:glycosyltransferase involved in cell wall biosynthesis